MEEYRARYVNRMRVWFLVILTVTITVFLTFQASTNVYQSWQITNFNRYRLTVVFGGDVQASEQTGFQSLTTPTAFEYTEKTSSKSAEHVTTGAVTDKRSKHSKTTSGLGENNFTAVVLLTYMRSGSSLTGDILQQPKDVFYLFEPLKSVFQLQTLNKTISYLNGTVMAPGTYDIRNVYLDTILGWLTCNISRVYVESLLDLDFLSLGNNLRSYSKCILRAGIVNNSKIQSERILSTISTHQRYLLKSCLNELLGLCLRSKYRILKTIRADMAVVAEVLENIKGSKVIHLVRDPRATIESQSHRKVCPLDLTNCIRKHCLRVREDISRKEKMDLVTLRRFQTVFYEGIATKPVRTAKTMYSFIGMEFTPVIEGYVYNVTLGKNKTGCSVCKLKWQIGNSVSSSKTHVEAWKRKLPSKYINRTQQLCNDVIKYYGYEYYTVSYNRKSKFDKKMVDLKKISK